MTSVSNAQMEKGKRYADGYPSLAAWAAHDPDNESYVFRKFDRMAARNLFNLQNELIILERSIDQADEQLRNGDMESKQSLRRWETYVEKAGDPARPEHKRMALEQQLKDKIKEYHEALLLQSQLCNLDRPSNRVLEAFRTLFTGKSPIVSGKAKEMLSDENDLVALCRPLEADPLSRFLRDHWLFPTRASPDSDNSTQFFYEKRVEVLVAAISVIVAAILLIGAILSLFYVKRAGVKLGLIAGFTVLFAISVGTLTSAKRQDVFASSAAYAAVLVVFVSGDLSGSGG